MNKTREEQLEAIRGKCMASNPEKKWEEWSQRYPSLADILLAIEERTSYESTGRGWEAMKDMVVPRFINGKLIREAYWDLLHDDVREQSDETVTFLANLLL